MSRRKPRMVSYGAQGLQRGVPKNEQHSRGLGTPPPTHGGNLPGQTPPIISSPGGQFQLPTNGGHGWPGQQTPPIIPQGGATGGAHIGTAASGLNIPTGLARRLKKNGLRVGENRQGETVTRARGSGYGTDIQRQLAQRLANQFGSVSNPFFDQDRAASVQGSLYDLGTGSGLNNGGSQNVLGDAQLRRVRGNAGWTPEGAYEGMRSRMTPQESAEADQLAQHYATIGKMPAQGLFSPEMYGNYLGNARANYMSGAQNVVGPGAPNPKPNAPVPGQTPPINPPAGGGGGGNNWNTGWANRMQPGGGQAGGTGPAGNGWSMGQNGQPQVSGGPSTAGKTTYGADRPASPGARGPQSFLPMTPQFEAGRRGLEDNLAAQLAQIGVAQEQIPAYLAMMTGRANTDQTYANQGLSEQMADRGLSGGSSQDYLNTRDIGIPFGRQAQDLNLGAAQQYADLAAQQGGAYLGYDQGLADLMLQRAQDVAQDQPLSLPQYRSKPKSKPKSRRKKRRN